MRLIDGDNVRDLFDAEFKETRKLILAGETHLDNLAEGFTEADRVIREMPTVDAEVVVRCKECEHAERYERIDGTVGYYCGHPQNTFTYGERWDRVFKPAKEPDGFCSRGERKDGGADNEM